MLRNLLVPFDGSPAGEHALPWAYQLARSTGAAIHLVRVHEIPVIPATGDGLIPNETALIADLEQRETESLNRVATEWHDDEAQITLVKTILQPKVSIAATLAEYATEHAVDLTVMTTHGRGPWSRALFGSVTDEYLRRTTRPTLLLRTDSDQSPARGTKPQIEKVVVPLDGSRFSEQAIDPAVRLFEWFGCAMELLMVIDAVDDIEMFIASLGHAPIPQEPRRPIRALAEAYLQNWAERLHPVAGRGTVRVVEHGEPSAIILGEADRPTVAVAMATHGRSGLSRAVFGSVADRVIRSSKGPVLIVRPVE